MICHIGPYLSDPDVASTFDAINMLPGCKSQWARWGLARFRYVLFFRFGTPSFLLFAPGGDATNQPTYQPANQASKQGQDARPMPQRETPAGASASAQRSFRVQVEVPAKCM